MQDFEREGGDRTTAPTLKCRIEPSVDLFDCEKDHGIYFEWTNFKEFFL